jgi:hypothetical protein
MRYRIATASARCSVVITALLVSQFSAVSESCAAKALRITDDDWAQSSGLSKPRAMAASMTGSGISTVSRRKPSRRRWRWRRTRSVLGLKECDWVTLSAQFMVAVREMRMTIRGSLPNIAKNANDINKTW